MNCIVHPSLDASFFEERVVEVEEKLEGEEMITFTYIFVRGPDDCGDIIDEVGDDERQMVKQACERSSSSSFRTEDREYLVIRVDEHFLQENESAARGLIAHELIHTVQRHSGVEKQIEQAAQARTDSVVAKMIQMGFSEEEAISFVRNVLSTMVFALKDLFANTEIIRQSFSDDIEEYYYHMLDVEGYCPMPEFYAEEDSLEDVMAAINFELRLMPAWLPFEALDSTKADEVQERITECYQQNLPQTSYHIKKVRDVYHDSFNKKDMFINEFFEQVLESSFDIIRKRILEGEPDQGSPDMFD